jgi:hypothetical protein
MAPASKVDLSLMSSEVCLNETDRLTGGLVTPGVARVVVVVGSVSLSAFPVIAERATRPPPSTSSIAVLKLEGEGSGDVCGVRPEGGWRVEEFVGGLLMETLEDRLCSLEDADAPMPHSRPSR